MTASAFFTKSPHLREQKWAVDISEDSFQKTFNLVHHVDDLRQSFTDYMMSLTSTMNAVITLSHTRLSHLTKDNR